MKNVCILSTVDLSRMTLLSLYTEFFDKNNIVYDIICANKYDDNYNSNANAIYQFDAKKSIKASVIGKVLHFWNMRKFASEIFKNNKYDYIIVWNQVTAFIFADLLIKLFEGKYCINIRDYHFDKLPIVRSRLTSVLKKADFNTISSEAFKRFLPKGDYLTIHSYNETVLKKLESRENTRKKNERINILNIGQIRWYDNIYPMIEELKNDPRFMMTFVGHGSEEIEKYIEGKNINNVEIFGRFKPQETAKFLEGADIIFNLYGTGNLHVDTALSIKLYYAIHLNVPILTYADTYMNEVASQIGIGYTVTKGEMKGFGDDLYNWYNSLNFEEIKEACDNYLYTIKMSHKELHFRLSQKL